MDKQYIIVFIGLAIALMGEPLAGATLMLGMEVGIALGWERARGAQSEVEDETGD